MELEDSEMHIAHVMYKNIENIENTVVVRIFEG